MILNPERTGSVAAPVDPKQATAVILVSDSNGLGVHIWLPIMRRFPGMFKNCIFVSVAEIDSGAFYGIAEIEALKACVRSGLEQFVALSRSEGMAAEYRMHEFNIRPELPVHSAARLYRMTSGRVARNARKGPPVGAIQCSRGSGSFCVYAADTIGTSDS